MTVTINAKGTSATSFKIGKTGPTLYQGTVDPSAIPQGDFLFDNSNGSLLYKGAIQTEWQNLVFDDITFADNSVISVTDDSTITLGSDITLAPADGSGVVITGTGNPTITTEPNESLYLMADVDVYISPSSGKTIVGGTGNSEIITPTGESLFIAPDSHLYLKGMQFPDSDGTVGQTLVTNGAGVLSWSTPVVALSADASAVTALETLVQQLTAQLSSVESRLAKLEKKKS